MDYQDNGLENSNDFISSGDSFNVSQCTNKNAKFNSGDKILINEYNKNSIFGNTSLIIGSRNTGKTTLINDMIIGIQNEVKEIHYISPSAHLQKLPYKTYNSIEDFDFKNYLEHISYKRNENEGIYNTILILNDCMLNKSIFENKSFRELIFNGKCYNITLIISMQFTLGISPEIRANFDNIFLFSEKNMTNIKRLWGHYGGIFSSFNTFKEIFSNLTKKFGVMIIENRVVDKDITDLIFWYKVDNYNNIGLLDVNKFMKLEKPKEIVDINSIITKVNFMIEKRNNKILELQKIIDDEKKIIEKLENIKNDLTILDI